jgi:hypothetical protein
LKDPQKEKTPELLTPGNFSKLKASFDDAISVSEQFANFNTTPLSPFSIFILAPEFHRRQLTM